MQKDRNADKRSNRFLLGIENKTLTVYEICNKTQ